MAWNHYSGYKFSRYLNCAGAIVVCSGLGLAVPCFAATGAPEKTGTAANAAQIKSQAVIMVFGDSLAAEYGLRRGSGWVSLLEQRLNPSKTNVTTTYKVVNASISGETTAGGASRIAAALALHKPTIVLIELGANDALRGLSLAQTQAHLTKMIKTARDAGAKPVLIGMRIPPNYGRPYSESFFNLFATVAKQEKTAYVPFLLAGMADQLDLFQADRIHPNERAQSMLLNNVYPALETVGVR